MLDMDRNKDANQSFSQTEKGKELVKKNPLGLLPLMQMFPIQEDETGIQQRKHRDDNLLQSVLFLRNSIVAHYDEQYEVFSGKKVSLY